MAENFYEMYLEEMEQIRPLDHEERELSWHPQPGERRRPETGL